MNNNTNLAKLLREHSTEVNPGLAALMLNAAKALDGSLPSIHSHWINRGRDKGYFCSNCGGGCLLNLDSEWHDSECCPHCGAKMENNNSDYNVRMKG